MAVSTPATLLDVYREFGAPAGTPLSAFLRGGAYVPNTPTNTGVPTSLPIRLSQLAGAARSGLNVSITGNDFYTTGNGIFNFAMFSNIVNGIGPFTYAWSISNSSGITTVPPTNQSNVGLRSTGTNVETYVILHLTVIDHGRGDAQDSDSRFISVQHGTIA